MRQTLNGPCGHRRYRSGCDGERAFPPRISFAPFRHVPIGPLNVETGCFSPFFVFRRYRHLQRFQCTSPDLATFTAMCRRTGIEEFSFYSILFLFCFIIYILRPYITTYGRRFVWDAAERVGGKEGSGLQPIDPVALDERSAAAQAEQSFFVRLERRRLFVRRLVFFFFSSLVIVCYYYYLSSSSLLFFF